MALAKDKPRYPPEQVAALVEDVVAYKWQLACAKDTLKNAQQAVTRAECNLTNAQNELNKALVEIDVIGGDYQLTMKSPAGHVIG